MTRRAEAAYAAFNAARGFKTAEGHATAEFEDLTPQIQQAWDAACEGVLRHWLDGRFRDAVMDDALLEAYAGRMLAVGVERKDPPLHTLRAAVGSFVRKVIAPETGTLKRREDL